MISVFLLILPIYLLIGLGYAAVRSNYVAASEIRGLGGIVLKLFMPAMMFLAIASSPISQVLRWDFILAYAGGSLTIYGLGFATARMAGRSFGDAAIEAMGMACSNSAYFGLPLATLVVGPQVALQAFALAVLVENLLMIPLAVSLCEAGQGAGTGAIRKVARGLIKSPLLIAALIGLGWSISGLAMPDPVRAVLGMMAPVAAPVALLTIGGTVAELSLRTFGPGVLRVVPGKLIGHPLAVFAAFALVGTVPDQLRLAGVLTAAAPMLSIYALFGQRFGREGMTATALIVATVLSFATISFGLVVIGAGFDAR